MTAEHEGPPRVMNREPPPPGVPDLVVTPLEHAVAPFGTSTHALLAAVIDNAPIGITVLDTDLRYLVINRVLAELNGLSAEEHLGRYVTDVLPDLDGSLVKEMRQVIESRTPRRDVEVSGRTPTSDGFKTWLIDLFPVVGADDVPLGVTVVVADVTAQRRGERRLGQVINSLYSFAGLCQPDGTLVEANRSALEAGGLSASDVVGRKVWQTPWFTWDPRVAEQLREACERALHGETSRYDVDVMMAGGLMTVDLQIAPVIEGGEVVAIVPSATDVTARRRSVEQATGVAALARRLNAATTADDVAEAIRLHTAKAIGCRHATLALLEAGGKVRLLQSPSLPESVARAFAELPLDSPVDVARCIRRGETVVTTDPVGLDDVDGSPEELERLRTARAEAGVTVTAATPLFDGNGDVIGSLAMGWPAVGDLDQEVLARLRTIGELCARAVERARFTDANLAAAQRSRALSSLAQALASAVTLDQVRQVVGRLAPAVVSARTAVLGLVDADHATLESQDPRNVMRRRLLSARRPDTDAARSGVPVVLGTPADHEARYPVLAARLPDPNPGATVVWPLRDNADRVIGTLELVWDAPTTFDPLLRPVIETIAEVCGQTIERARLHAAEHELVDGLQRRLLRPVPTVAGLDTHAVYRTAQTAVGIGGDFHDGLVLPGCRLAVVLGDVAGHGMEAAADMAQLRTLLSTLLAGESPLERLFPQAEAALGHVAGITLATAVAAVVDPAARTLTYTHAGHPPLVLRRPDGRTVTLDDGRAGLLGAGIVEAAAGSAPFGPGSVLVGYTDGLVETRAAGLDEGIAALVEAVDDVCARATRLDAARIADAVLDRCVGGRRLTDDVALLVVSYPCPC